MIPRFIILFCFLSFISCNNSKTKNKKEKRFKWSKEQSYEMNKSFVKEEESEINDFLERHKDWKTIKTGSGLRYFIYNNVSGETAKVGMIAKIKFTISLLDGTICYESNNECSLFKIDKSDVESGLNEGIKFMSVGDKAKLIIPSAIALGLVGDLDKIPTYSTIIYDVELIELIPI